MVDNLRCSAVTMPSVEGYIAQSLHLSREMYFLAEQEDWVGLGKLENVRTQTLTSLFSHPSLPLLLVMVADALQQIVIIDRKMIALKKNFHQKLMNEMVLFCHRQG